MSNPLDSLILPSPEELRQAQAQAGAQTGQPPAAQSNPLDTLPLPTDGANPLDTLSLPKLSPDQKKYWDLQKEKENYGLFDSLRPAAIESRGGNILASRGVADDEVKAYAAHYGLDFETARKLATLRGAVPPMSQIDSVGELLEAAAGKLNIATGNLAGWLGKKTLTDDPKLRAFLDDIGELADGRAGLAETAIGIAMPGVGFAKAAKFGKAAAIAGSTATGGLYGLAGSKEGKEAEGAATSAVVGAGLGAAGLGLQKLFSNRGKKIDIDPETQKNIDEAATNFKTITGEDLTQTTAQEYSKVKASHDKMRDAFIEKKPIDEDDAAIILEQQVSPDTKEIIKSSLRDRFIQQLPTEEQAAAKQMVKEGKSFAGLDDATSDLKIAEEVVRMRKDEFVEELANRTPEIRFIQADAQARGLRATNDEVLENLLRSGPENLKRNYDSWTAGNIALSKLQDAGVKVDPNADALGKGVINFATDRMFGFKVMDERYGGDILSDFYQVNTNYNLFTAFKQAAAKDVAKVFKLAKENGLNKTRAMEEFYQKLEAGSPLSPGEQKVANAMRDYFEKQRQFFNSARGDGYSPMNIPYRPDFVAPQMMVKPVDYVIRMRQKLSDVEKAVPNLKDMDTETFMREVNVRPELRDLKIGIELASDMPVTNGREMVRAFQDATNKGGTAPRLYRLASTTLPRKGVIPDFLRERNIFKLMTNYSEGTGRQLYLREPLSRMVDKAKLLDGIGAKDEADFVRRFVQDNLGIRQKSMARIGNQARIAFAETLDSALRKVIKDDERRESVLAGFRFLPEMAANLQYNIYPNVLGMNPRAHLAQLTQVLFKTAPEMGGTYGYTSAMKSMTNALIKLATKEGRKEFYGQVKALGLEPSGYVREAREGLAEGLEASIGFSVPAKVIRNMADAFMWSYGKMDTLNRAVTLDMSKRLVTDIATGEPAAMRALSRMPISVRRQVLSNKGNDLAQLKAIATHLNAATQFNYNRASMSEIGVTLGPLFSTFTKWPLAISGDILADMRTKGVFKSIPRVAEKYLAVYLLAKTMDSITYSLLTDEDLQVNPEFKNLSDGARRVFGAGGFTSMAPIESLKAFVPPKKGEPAEKSLFTPPLYDTFYSGILAPILDGDTEALAKGGLKAAETFAPGGFLANFLLKDIPLYFGDGTRPKDVIEGLEFYQ
jgi:hypothetical protein